MHVKNCAVGREGGSAALSLFSLSLTIVALFMGVDSTMAGRAISSFFFFGFSYVCNNKRCLFGLFGGPGDFNPLTAGPGACFVLFFFFFLIPPQNFYFACWLPQAEKCGGPPQIFLFKSLAGYQKPKKCDGPAKVLLQSLASYQKPEKCGCPAISLYKSYAGYQKGRTTPQWLALKYPLLRSNPKTTILIQLQNLD